MKPQMDRGHTTSFYEFGPFRLDPVKRLLLHGSASVPLTQKAFDTLLVLVQNSERVVHKDELMRLVWPDTIVEENNLTQSISMLRKALGESRKDHKYIVTIQGRGYRFVAECEEFFDATNATNDTQALSHISKVGEKDKALPLLRKAHEKAGAHLMLKLDPRLDVLRSDSAFDEVLKS